MANKIKNQKEDMRDPVSKRLDSLIRLFIEVNRPESPGLNEGIAARVLRSAGLTPTEIAVILGKKSATDVAKYLYIKKK